MRLVLEKDDLIKILNNHFNENFDPERVQVRAEPFEVELTGIPLAAPEPKAPAFPAQGTGSITAKHDPSVRAFNGSSVVLGQDAGFDGPVRVTDPDLIPDDADLIARRSGRNAYAEPPPYTDDEVDGAPNDIIAQSRALEAELATNKEA